MYYAYLLRHFCSLYFSFFTYLWKIHPQQSHYIMECPTISKTDFLFEIIIVWQSYQETICILRDIWYLDNIRLFYR